MNQKQKGNRREREFANICKAKGFTEAHRTQQFCGNTQDDASDVNGLPYIHCEVKGTQVTDINKFMKQSRRDSAKKNRFEIPCVFYKRNNQPWLAVMDLDEWFEMYKVWLKEIEANEQK